MALIADCPNCSSPLSVPAGGDGDAHIQCPLCQAEFSLADCSCRRLPEARLIHRAESYSDIAIDEPHVGNDSDTILWSPKNSPASTSVEQAGSAPPAEIEQSFDDAYADADPAIADPANADRDVQHSLDFEERLSDLVTEPDQHEQLPLDLKDEDEHEVVGTLDVAAAETLSELRTSPRRKRKPAGLKSLVGILGGGVMGLLLGGYILLWLRGPEADILKLARWLPNSMLPATAQQPAADPWGDAPAGGEPDLGDSRASVDANARPPANDGWKTARTFAADAPTDDTPVTPATAAEPAAEAAPEDQSELRPTTSLVEDLREVKFYSSDELAAVLQEAEPAPAQFLAGNLSQRESFATMGRAYMQMCALAERFTLLNPQESANGLVSEHDTLQQLVQSLVRDKSRRGDVATVAAQWLRHEARPNQGVILVGRVRMLAPHRMWTEYVLEMDAGGERVEANLLMNESQLPQGGEVAVAGAIVRPPREHVIGYEGDAEQVVVVGSAFDPDQPMADGVPASSDSSEP